MYDSWVRAINDSSKLCFKHSLRKQQCRITYGEGLPINPSIHCQASLKLSRQLSKHIKYVLISKLQMTGCRLYRQYYYLYIAVASITLQDVDPHSNDYNEYYLLQCHAV